MFPRDTTENVSISFETELIELMEKYCFNKDVSRSRMVNRAVRLLLLAESDNPEIWSILYQKILR